MFFLVPSRILSINLCLKWTDLRFITDSVRTWGPYLYTTVSDKHQTVFCFFCFFASNNVFAVTSRLCSPCWTILAWQTSAAQRWRYRRRWSSSSSRRPQSFGPWLRRWWSRSVLVGGGTAEGTLPHDGKRMFYQFLFSRQNTNGVNFYNILTQQPEEKLEEEKLRTSTENFIGKRQDQIIPVSSTQNHVVTPGVPCFF